MLECCDLSFSYPKKQIFDRFSLSLQDGELLAIMGDSGCGKTTLLSLIAGLQKPTSGTIRSSFERIAYVFQEPRLFPWLTVYQNIEAVLPKQSANERIISEALQEVGLSDSATLLPHELSGGMKSRVALARALAYGGDLYLLDEPFAALDEELRTSLATSLRARLQRAKASAILVTHQLSDAQRIADRILYL